MFKHFSKGLLSALLLCVSTLPYAWATESCAAADGADKAAMKALCDEAANLVKTQQGVPDSPAFAILGLKPETVARPRTPDDLALSLLNAVDANGNGQMGFALDFVPYMVFAGKTSTLRDYQTDTWVRLLSNTQVSFAYTDGQDKADESRRFAFGIHITPWMADDPRMNHKHIECVAKASAEALLNPDLPLPGADEAAPNESLRKKAIELSQSCREHYASDHWNASAWTIGLTPAWKSTSGKADDLGFDGLALWSSVAWKPDTVLNLGSLVAHIKYRVDEELPITGGTRIFKQDSIVLAMRYEYGRENFNVAVETSYIDALRDLAKDDQYLQFSAGLNYRLLTSDFWLRASVGRTSGRQTNDETVFGLSLAWGNNTLSLLK